MKETYKEKETNQSYLVTDAVLYGYRENYTKGCLVRPTQEHSKVVVLLFYVHDKQVWSVNLTTLFLGRLRPHKRLTSTSTVHILSLVTDN